MNSGKDHMNDLRTLIDEVAQELTERCHLEFNAFLGETLGFSEEDDPIPLEVCTGIAQGLADASGFRVILQAAILEPIEGRGKHVSRGRATRSRRGTPEPVCELSMTEKTQ